MDFTSVPERLDLKGVTYCLKPTVRKSGKADRSFGACGKCESCLRRRRAQWIGKLLLEHAWQTQKHGNESAIFLTLTYNNENLGSPSLMKDDLVKFWKRYRSNTQKHVRYFCAGEYGSLNGRKHWHCLVWGPNLRNPVVRQKRGRYSTITGPKLETLNLVEQLTEAWGNGFVHVSTINPKRVAYCAKYATKYNSHQKPIVIYSARPGLGRNYLAHMMLILAKSSPNLKRVPSTYQIGTRRYSMGATVHKFCRDKYLEYGGQITDNEDSTTLFALRCDFQIGWTGKIQKAKLLNV